MEITIYVVAIVATLSLGVIVHELGHCIAAKLASVEVEHFDIGVGPTILKRTDRKGMVFNLKLIPLGGFAQLLDGHGSEITEDNRARSFQEAKPAWKLFITLAGSGTNFFVAFVIILAIQLGNVAQSVPTVDVAGQDTKAYAAGLRSGDRIVGIDGVETTAWQDIGGMLLDRVGDTGTLELNVTRDGQRQDYAIPIQDWESDKRFMDIFGDIGIAQDASAATFTSNSSVFGRMVSAVVETFTMGITTAAAGFKMIFREMSILNFFGPLELLQLGEDGSQLGYVEYAKLVALFFIALGIINLLPGPVVDGNGVVLSFGELVTGKRPSPRIETITLYAGFTLGWGPLFICITYEILRSFG